MNPEFAVALLFLLIGIVTSCAIPFFGEKVRAKRLSRAYAPLLTMPVEEWPSSVMIDLGEPTV